MDVGSERSADLGDAHRGRLPLRAHAGVGLDPRPAGRACGAERLDGAGTAGDDVIDTAYTGDPDGDMIDNASIPVEEILIDQLQRDFNNFGGQVVFGN